jgi:integrase
MAVKEVKSGYVIDFTIEHQRYRETIPARHNKTNKKRILDQEAIYKMAITISDKSYLDKHPNSKILQKAFKCESDSFTIDQYSSIWFKQKQRNWAPSTIRGYSQKYNFDIKPNFGHIRLKNFKGSMFDEWASGKNLSGKSINEIRSILNQIFKRAFFDGVIDFNPIERIERYKQEVPEPQPFTKDEIERILNSLKSPYREFYQFAIWTGLRTGELIGLRWQDIDLIKGSIHIRTNIIRGVEKEPKTKGSIRNFELHDEAIKALENIISSDFYDEFRIFINISTRTTYKDADGIRKRIWKPALERANVEYRCPYQCRHTFASMMLSKGERPIKVAAQMGHIGLKMINERYGRWIPSHD